MLIVTFVLLIIAGLVAINCKKNPKESRSTKRETAKELDDSTFVELAARQNLLIQKYYVKTQQAKSDSEKTLLSEEFKKETEKILNIYGISRDQINNYVKEMESDSLKAQKLQRKIVNRIKELVAEAKKNANQ